MKGFGKFTVEETAKVTPDKKRSDSKTNFKGKGLMGGLAGKLLLRSGEEGKIIDLNAMSIYKMNHKEKEYQVVPIEKLKTPEKAEGEGSRKMPAAEPEAEKESDVRVVRSEFKVTDTGEEKNINNFPCCLFNPKKMFGGFAKKLMKKKEAPKELEPAFAYYTELFEYKASEPAESDFTVPANYKQK